MNVDIEHASSNNIGALLKASRDRLGEDVYAVSRALRIRQRYLQAIEDGAYDELPGPTYAVGFVRAYAEYVGLDGEEVVRRFKAETSALDGAAELRFPSPIPESGVPGRAILLVGLLIAAVAYGTRYVLSERDGFLAEVISPLPERFRSLVDGEDGGQGSAPPPAEPSTTVSASAATSASASPASESAEATSEGSAGTGDEDADSGSATTLADAAPYPPPPSPGHAGEDGDREPANVESESRIDAAADASMRAATPDTTTVGEGAAASASSEDSGPSDDAGSEEVREQPVAPPVAVAATSESASEAETPSTVQGADLRNAGSAGASTTRDGADAADSSPTPMGQDVDPAPVVGEQISAPTPPIASADEAGSAETAGTAMDIGNQVAAAPTDPTPAERPIVGTGIDGSASGGRVFGETDDVRIVVRARIDSFIQVRDDGANRMLVTRLLRAGDIYRVPARPGLKLSTGNAGALEILVDGEVVPPIGGEGVVLQGVALEVERLRTGFAVSE